MPKSQTPEFPSLDGAVRTSERERLRVAGDYGNFVHRTPKLVVDAASVADVVKLCRYCHASGIPLVARGRGHSGEGQSQVENGIVLKTEEINSIEINGRTARIGAGAQWKDVVAALFLKGFKVPILTDYLGLTVGGTLSVGGVGKGSHSIGLQTDHVIEVTVVIADGTIARCSRTRNRRLFSAVLGGLGQFGIIVEAVLRIAPAKPFVFVATREFDERESFLRELNRAAKTRAIYSVEGIRPGGKRYLLKTSVEAINQTLTTSISKILGEDPAPVCQRYDEFVSWNVDHNNATPMNDGGFRGTRRNIWLDVIVPAAKLEKLLVASRGLFGKDAWEIFIPIRRQGDIQPSLSPLPAAIGRESCLVLFLREVHTARAVERELVANYKCLRMAWNLGGYGYLTDGIPRNREEWTKQLGPQLAILSKIKNRVDPTSILAPELNVAWDLPSTPSSDRRAVKG